MLTGTTQRTAVAIALMGVLLLTVGACVLPAQHATHSCCMHMSMPCGSVNANCCVAVPHAPSAMVTQAFHGQASVEVAQDFFSADIFDASQLAVTAAVVPPQSPPPGNFILRI
jgi:hypothetical protein